MVVFVSINSEMGQLAFLGHGQLEFLQKIKSNIHLGVPGRLVSVSWLLMVSPDVLQAKHLRASEIWQCPCWDIWAAGRLENQALISKSEACPASSHFCSQYLHHSNSMLLQFPVRALFSTQAFESWAQPICPPGDFLPLNLSVYFLWLPKLLASLHFPHISISWSPHPSSESLKVPTGFSASAPNSSI